MSEKLALPHIAARVFDVPLLIAQRKLDAIVHVLSARMGFDLEEPAGDELNPEQITAERYEARLASLAPTGMRVERKPEGYYVIGDVAIVPVLGTLVQRSSWLDSWSGLMSYAKVEAMHLAALADPMVREILVEYDSHGGEAAGAFDSADRLYAMRGSKPITAIAAEVAFSGGYLLASNADEIVVPRSGAVGSIGVVSAHFDHSKAIERRGIAVTYIYAGDRKIDGSPFMPLTSEAKADWQDKIDSLYGLFVDAVARNMGLSVEGVRATQAAIYMGPKAVEAKLAHRVASFEQELSAAITRQAGPFRLNAQTTEVSMSGSDKGNGGPATITAEDVTRARTEGHAAGIEEGRKEIAPAVAAGVTGERARIKGIMMHAEADGRAELAAHLAFDSEMNADAAGAILAKSAKANAQSPLSAAMEREVTGRVPNQPAAKTQGEQPVIDANAIFASRAAAAKDKR